MVFCLHELFIDSLKALTTARNEIADLIQQYSFYMFLALDYFIIDF